MGFVRKLGRLLWWGVGRGNIKLEHPAFLTPAHPKIKTANAQPAFQFSTNSFQDPASKKPAAPVSPSTSPLEIASYFAHRISASKK